MLFSYASLRFTCHFLLQFGVFLYFGIMTILTSVVVVIKSKKLARDLPQHFKSKPVILCVLHIFTPGDYAILIIIVIIIVVVVTIGGMFLSHIIKYKNVDQDKMSLWYAKFNVLLHV